MYVWKFSHNEHRYASGVGAPPLNTQHFLSLLMQPGRELAHLMLCVWLEKAVMLLLEQTGS